MEMLLAYRYQRDVKAQRRPAQGRRPGDSTKIGPPRLRGDWPCGHGGLGRDTVPVVATWDGGGAQSTGKGRRPWLCPQRVGHGAGCSWRSGRAWRCREGRAKVIRLHGTSVRARRIQRLFCWQCGGNSIGRASAGQPEQFAYLDAIAPCKQLPATEGIAEDSRTHVVCLKVDGHQCRTDDPA